MPLGVFPRTKEHCENISRALKGRRTSPRTEFKKGHKWILHREGCKCPVCCEETRNNLPQRFKYGQSHPKEWSEKRKKTILKRFGSLKLRDDYSHTQTKEFREKISKAHKGIKDPKISEFRKKFNREHPEKHPNRIMGRALKGLKGKYVSNGQLFVYRLIEERFKGLNVELEYPIHTDRSTRFADIGIPALKIDVEFDNPFWHDSDKDHERDVELEGVGWKTIRVTEEVIQTLKEMRLIPPCTSPQKPPIRTFRKTPGIA